MLRGLPVRGACHVELLLADSRRLRLEECVVLLEIPASRVIFEATRRFVRKLNIKVVQSKIWPDIKPAICRAQEMLQFLIRHVRMLESRRITIEFLPVCFGDEVLHVFEKRSTGIRRQDLEERQRASQFDGIVDCRAYAVDRVGEKAEYVKAFGTDSFVTAKIDDCALMIGRNGPTADTFQSRR